MAPEPRRFTLTNGLEALAALRAEVRALALAHGLAPAAAEDFELCLHEAASNAIVHGNRGEPGAPVEIAIEPEGAGLRATVRNGGPGFDFAAMVAGLQTAGERPRGRGFLVIASLVDDFEWRDEGRELTFAMGR
jgi:serine/threonine-protein kinase RsbW